jgi:hypothetical protein
VAWKAVEEEVTSKPDGGTDEEWDADHFRRKMATTDHVSVAFWVA